MRFRRSGAGAVSAILLLLLALWPAPVAAQTVKLGAVVPLTGRYGGGGAQVRAGYELAVEHFNAAGGVSVGGKKLPLELVLLDDESDATKTVSRLETLPAAARVKTVAIFQEKTDWGAEMARAWAAGAKGAGYQVVVQAEYAPGAKDFSDMVLKAKSAAADAVFGLPTPPDGMTLVKQMKELDYTPKMLLLIRAPDPPIWSKNLGKDGDFVILAPGWHHAVKAPGVSELNEAHQKKFGRPADPIAGPAYACVQIVANALTRAGALDREKLRAAVAATDMTTVEGPVKFRPDGTGIVQSVFVQWINGKQELVWPRESATTPVVYPAPPFAKR